MELAVESTSERQTENTFKLVLLGSADVGKSSLVLRYIRDDFRETVSTTGCAFFSHRVHVQGRILHLEIWDTAGQERYHSVSHLYYRSASAALLVYDITSKESFSRAQIWFQELQKYVFGGEMVIALVGNKRDLQDKGKVSREDAQAFAEQKGLLFIETSAKTGEGVKEVFEAVAHELLALERQKEEKQRRRDSFITLEESGSSSAVPVEAQLLEFIIFSITRYYLFLLEPIDYNETRQGYSLFQALLLGFGWTRTAYLFSRISAQMLETGQIPSGVPLQSMGPGGAPAVSGYAGYDEEFSASMKLA